MSLLVFRMVTGALCGALVLAGCGDDGSGGNGGGGTGGENAGGSTSDGGGDTGGSDGVGGEATGGSGGGTTAGTCGWSNIGIYECGYSGEDPDGVVPYDCPANPMEGDPCGAVTGAGCCDPDGNNWYCALDNGKGVLTKIDCGV
ncbi:MAG: hypothetical protein HOW73_44895 [Polyangiaceae bacterium]|nr:hypothetical protein [Polyangiaceae bacterium]